MTNNYKSFSNIKKNATNHFLVSTDRFLYRSSQKNLRRKFLSAFLFVIIGLLLSYIITIYLGQTPNKFFDMFSKVFQSISNAQLFLYSIAIYATAALAFSFAMNVGIFNIGISGQMLAGGSTAVLLISVFPKSFTDNVVIGGQFLTILFSIIGAVTVSMIIGLLKVYLKVNEVVSAILLNWIILYIVAYLVRKFDLDINASNIGNFQSNKMPNGFSFYQEGNGFIKNSGWLWSICVMLVCVIFVWVLMKFTVFGHKLKTTGLSQTASHYFGYNQNALKLSTFAISGVLAGVLGAIVYTGQPSYLNFHNAGGFALNAIPIEGFNGIAIGLIALNNPIGIVMVSVLFAFISAGSAPASMPSSTISLVTGIMMYMISIYSLSLYLRPWRLFYLFKYGKINSDNYLNFENNMAENTENYCFSLLDKKNKLVDSTVFHNKHYKNKFISNCLKFYYKFIGVYFLKNNLKENQYKKIKNEVLSNYLKRRNEIIKEFKYSCGYSLVLWWKNNSEIQTNINGDRLVNLSKWKKDKYRIDTWLTNIENDDIINQVNKHIFNIDNNVSYLFAFDLLNLWTNKLAIIKYNDNKILKDWIDDKINIQIQIKKISNQELKNNLINSLNVIDQKVVDLVNNINGGSK